MRNRVYISRAAGRALLEHIRESGAEIIFTEPLGTVAAPIADHPDLIFCRLNEKRLFVGDGSLLSDTYPKDVIYNACSTGKYFIHNLRFTDRRLLAAAAEEGLRTVDVKQGYAKCSTVAVDEDSVITYDRGIAKECLRAGMSVLTVRPGHVRLEGYSTGFIGGASGRLGDVILFNGDITAHPDYPEIKAFIEERGLRVKGFGEYPLTDIGSIIQTGA